MLDRIPYGTIDSHGDHVEVAGFVCGFGYFEEVFVDLYADAGGVGEEHVSALSFVLVDEEGVGGMLVSEGVFLGDEVGDGCVDLAQGLFYDEIKRGGPGEGSRGCRVVVLLRLQRIFRKETGLNS